MARGDTLRKLFKSFSENDREEFQAAAIQLIQEEKDKKHLLLANDLEQILDQSSSKKLASNNLTWHNYPEVPKDKDTGLPLIEVIFYKFDWNRVVLSKQNLKILERIVLENRKQEILNSYGLKSTSKVLFCGSPGCGKTITAKVLAGVLELPLVYVNLSSVFSSYLGETAVNLKKIFDYIKKGQWVILFDEFDALAKDRNTHNDHGEIKRLVNSLLQLIDSFNEPNIFIAATNYESLLDKAIWRRFDEILIFNKPDYYLRYSLLKKNLSNIHHSNLNIDKLASTLQGATGADIEKICFDAIKSVILKGEKNLTENEMEEAIGCYLERRRIVEELPSYRPDFIENEDDAPV